VDYVEGNTIVVKMSTGQYREFTVPDSRTFVIDGKEVTVHDLKPGTSLSATITTTTTSVTQRTKTNLTGKVWHVQGYTVILTLPDGTNHMYLAKSSDLKFMVDGKEATYFNLKKGMTVTAEKIVEAPLTEVASDTTVTGHSPRPKAVVAEAPAPAPARRAAPAPAEVAATPSPAPVQVAAAPSALPAKLPKTGSFLPLAGILGLLFMSAGFGLHMLRRA
jgi:LPXTG-motif cell wall-anchored protein